MALNERQNQIIKLLEKERRLSVATLAKTLFASEMTIRRDLKLLEREGLLKRYHGGALVQNDYIEYPLALRLHVNEKEKRELAMRVSQYVKDGQTIFLTNSSSCAYIIPSLKNYKNLLVITNSVQFATALSHLEIKCILAGGEYRESENCLVGRETERFLRSVNADIAFLSCDGCSNDGVITVNDAANAEIVKIAYQNSLKRIFLVHRSKLGSKYTYTICKTDEADEIIVF